MRLKQAALVFIVGLTFIQCEGPANKVKRLKLGHGLDPTHSVHLAMVYMAERVADYSKGKLQIDIYPSQQLGAQRELIELLQIGSVDITKTSAAVMENFSPLMQVFSLPYVFRDSIHEQQVLRGPIGKEILEGGIKYYLRGLCYYDAGKRSFYTKDRRITKPADLIGLKIRVQASKTAIELVNAFGAAATPISFGELYTALQQGVVDGAENNPPSFYLTRHYEICKYYTLNEHTAVPDVLLISEHTWKKLGEEEKSWVEKAAFESAIYQSQLWEEAEQRALSAVEKAGVEIIIPDKSDFATQVAELSQKLITLPEVKEVFDRIQNMNINE